jgi:hypothetical protein
MGTEGIGGVKLGIDNDSVQFSVRNYLKDAILNLSPKTTNIERMTIA